MDKIANTEVRKEIYKLSLRIVLIYLIYGLAWIFFTDKLAYILIKNPYYLTTFQTTKGFLFIGISGLILYGFLWQTFARIIHSENKIRESETMWRSLVSNAPDIVMMLDRSGKIKYINRNLDGILRADAVGKKITEVLPKDISAEYAENLKAVFQNGEIKSFELKLETSSSGLPPLWLDTKMAPIEKEGEIETVISFARDITNRKIAEKSLRESEERFQKIFDHSNDAIILLDPTDEKILDANSRACEMLGYDKGELLTAPLSQLHPYDTDQFRKFTHQILNNESGTSRELISVAKSGLTRCVEISASSIDMDGQTYILCLVRDISERKKAEQEISLLAHALKSISECIVITNVEGEILFVNEAFLTTYGYSEEELIGESIDVIRSEKNHPGLSEQIITATLGGGWQGELYSRRRDGSDFPIFLSTSIIPDENGKPTAFIGVSKDISAQKQAEKALRESEEKYRTLFEESKDVVFISTPEGNFLDINQAGVELFGYSSKEELLQIDIGKDLYVNREDREKYKEFIARQGYVKDFESVVKRKDGERLTILETARAVYDQNGKIIKLRGIVRDITEKKRLEEQLRQAQKLQSLGNLAGGIAHDFNNILGIILGYASMVENGHIDPQKVKWNANAIIKAVNRGSALVQQILTFARKKDVLFETIKVNATIRELTRLAQETFPKTITFSLDLQKDLPYIKGDHSQIHQALLNLFVNARDAMTGGGKLSVETSTINGRELRKSFPDAADQEYVSIVISDEGIGMNKETLNRIFEPFYTTKKRGKGTGLGLAVVYGVVASHHGFIDVQSELSKGTTFYLYFPVTSQPIESEEGFDIEQVDLKGGKETILFVEDEELLRELIENVLSESGYKVLTATDGEEAVELFSQNADQIDLVITDLGLPKLDGWNAYLKMNEYKPDLKMILASGYLDPEIRAELSGNSHRSFIQKPYNLIEMLNKVREIIEAPSHMACTPS